MMDTKEIFNNNNTIKKFPGIMGILNVTPDSFSDGGSFYNTESAVDHALEMLDDGADIIDIGGESSRPGAEPVSINDEISRTSPIIEKILKLRNDAIISIDTVKYEVAKSAIDAGAKIINDISGLTNDIRLAELASKYNLPLILMHMQGVPRNMQVNPKYGDVISEVFVFLKKRIEIAKNKGVNEVIADVGIGFGKTFEHNIMLLNNLDKFTGLGTKLLLGVSRKSFIGKLLGIDNPKDRDIATALIHTLLLKKDIDIIRVHNVKLIQQIRKIAEIID